MSVNIRLPRLHMPIRGPAPVFGRPLKGKVRGLMLFLWVGNSESSVLGCY